jgi:hypothetical protein
MAYFTTAPPTTLSDDMETSELFDLTITTVDGKRSCVVEGLTAAQVEQVRGALFLGPGCMTLAMGRPPKEETDWESSLQGALVN